MYHWETRYKLSLFGRRCVTTGWRTRKVHKEGGAETLALFALRGGVSVEAITSRPK